MFVHDTSAAFAAAREQRAALLCRLGELAKVLPPSWKAASVCADVPFFYHETHETQPGATANV